MERWWRDKFFPRRHVEAVPHTVFWADFALLAAYVVGFVALLALIGGALPQSSATAAVAWGFVVPFLVWNLLMGATPYFQPTHQRAPWIAGTADWLRLAGHGAVRACRRVARWS